MTNHLDGAGALSKIGLHGGCKQDSACSGLGGDGQVCDAPRTLPVLRVLSPLTYGMRRRSSYIRCTMLCAAGRMSA